MDRIKPNSREIESLKSKIIDCKLKIKELSSVIEMETPSLQMKMEEIRELEAEMNVLEEELRVCNSCECRFHSEHPTNLGNMLSFDIRCYRTNGWKRKIGCWKLRIR